MCEIFIGQQHKGAPEITDMWITIMSTLQKRFKILPKMLLKMKTKEYKV